MDKRRHLTPVPPPLERVDRRRPYRAGGALVHWGCVGVLAVYLVVVAGAIVFGVLFALGWRPL